MESGLKKRINKNKYSEDSFEKLHLRIRKYPPTSVKLVIFEYLSMIVPLNDAPLFRHKDALF